MTASLEPTVLQATPADLVGTARGLVSPGRRTLLGITGAPGAGKSTLAEFLVRGLGDAAVGISMDGFHLSNTELTRLGRLERKGAPDTFDAAGFVHLLRRLRDGHDDVVYAPVFDRSLEESIGSAAPVPARVPLVVVEGNYLLADGPYWGQVRGLLDECWYLDPGEQVRVEWLLARHRRYGRSEAEAQERSSGSDGANARLVAGTRARATRVIEVLGLDVTS